MDVATRAPALGFRTDPSRERRGRRRRYVAFLFGEGTRVLRRDVRARSEPPRKPSVLALAAFANVPNATRSDATRPETTSNAIPGDAEARIDIWTNQGVWQRRTTDARAERRRTKRRRKRRHRREPLSRTTAPRDIRRGRRLRTVRDAGGVRGPRGHARSSRRARERLGGGKLLPLARRRANRAASRTRTDSSWTRRGRSPSGTYERKHPRPRLNTRTIRPPVSRCSTRRFARCRANGASRDDHRRDD